jgi:sulfite reductase (NADPH) flavoprotein alpha-component
MTAAARLPDNAPFAPDAIAQLNRVIGQSTPTQRAWLSGFLAGLEAGHAPAVAAPPIAKQKLTVLFATESGNSEALAARAKRDASKLGFAARTLDAADATPATLADAGTLLVIASTWGEGEAPQRATAFLDALLAEDAPRLDRLRFAVLALGDRAYAQFCETGRVIDERLAALGALRVADRLECDLDYETPAAAWLGTTLPLLRSADEAADSVIHVDFGASAAGDERGETVTKANPFAAEVTTLQNVNSSRSGKQTFHVELSLAGSGITYQPGDAIGVVPENDPALVEQVLAAVHLDGEEALHQALGSRHDITTLTGHFIKQLGELSSSTRLIELAADKDALAAYLPGRQVLDLLVEHPVRLAGEQLLSILRPLPPRLYSVASSQRATPDEAHLLVSAVRYRTHGRDRGGVASTWIADRRRVGDTVPVYVKPNAHFRLPQDGDTPVIMIGPGTGVAPFRAFMQDRDESGAKGRSWLFFGDRHYTHDFLYQLEWQDFLKRRVLSRLDVAFSRDQDAKVYVQDRILERADTLHGWIQDGARIYVCGDQAHMAKDVHAALRTVIARGQSLSDERAEAELSQLKAQGRYLLDVY